MSPLGASRHLRNLLAKGLNFRESPFISKNRIVKDIDSDLDNFIEKMLKVNKFLEKSDFDTWKSSVMSKITKELDVIKYPLCRSTTVLSKKLVQQELLQLQKKYIITRIDKAGNNVHFTCKKYYLQVIANELTTTNTYKQCRRKVNDIISDHSATLQTMGIPVEEKHMKLPKIYALPKQHKTPVKFRFIAAGVKCTTKTLLKTIKRFSSALKHMF